MAGFEPATCTGNEVGSTSWPSTCCSGQRKAYELCDVANDEHFISHVNRPCAQISKHHKITEVCYEKVALRRIGLGRNQTLVVQFFATCLFVVLTGMQFYINTFNAL